VNDLTFGVGDEVCALTDAAAVTASRPTIRTVLPSLGTFVLPSDPLSDRFKEIARSNPVGARARAPVERSTEAILLGGGERLALTLANELFALPRLERRAHHRTPGSARSIDIPCSCRLVCPVSG
jgi:hypothetical protein